MGAKTEALAREFEGKVRDALATLEKLGDADWKKVTEAERWTVGVTAHHVAGSHELIAGIIKTVAAGDAMPNFTLDMLHASNAKHARDFANVSKAETIALHQRGAATAAAVVRGLSDDQLANSGTVLTGLPAMTAEQVVTDVLINHIHDHFGSIRKTVGG